jgi:hypothetical protein
MEAGAQTREPQMGLTFEKVCWRSIWWPRISRKSSTRWGMALHAPLQVKRYALKSGFYVIEQSGDTVKIDIPEGFKPREW